MKRGSSQWEFGELFPSETARRVHTVSELTGRIRRLIEQQLGEIWVTGEVTNLRAQSSGHFYFTLKDASAQLSCVLFRSEAAAHREYLEDGQKLLLQGTLTVYEPRGQYQLIVRAVELQGVGALQVAFERLKRRLQAEGLFALDRKRPLPRYPQRLGLVTSPTGAAIRDVLHVIARRHSGLEIVLAPCRVQGDGAAAEVAGALRLLNRWNQSCPPSQRIDLILVTRGGGSLEDLWAFNEEILARAIFESALPVISAVGHEIDFTISDFVADLRAATPSAAAELITEGMFASRQALSHARQRLQHLTRAHLEAEHNRWEQLAQRLARVHPRRRLQEQIQHVDDLTVRLWRCARHGWRRHQRAWSHLQQRLGRLKPALIVLRKREQLHAQSQRLTEAVRHLLSERRGALAHLTSRLQLLGPHNVLARGYSITLDDATGHIVRNAAETSPGMQLRTRLQTGEVKSVVR